MNVLVELNSSVNNFNINERQKKRLKQEFPQHDFIFLSYDDFKSKLNEADIALVWLFPEHLYSIASKLTAIYTPAAGRDWVTLDPSGKVKVHYSSFHGEIIGESFLAMLLYANNGLKTALKNQAQAKWDRNAFSSRTLLKNQSLLIIGYGNIGRHCARLASSLGLSISVCSRTFKDSPYEYIPVDKLSSSLSHFDHVLNLLPGDQSTEGFISEYLFAQFKDGSNFYNYGRGTTVDERALVKALDRGQVSFAGLDVTSIEPLPESSPLWSHSQVLLTPHSSCIYDDYLDLFIDGLRGRL